MRWLWTRIKVRIETAAVLDLDIEEARQTLAQLETDTWGIALREIEGERVVVLPAGTLADPPWTVGGRQVEALERHVAQFSGQVTRLARDYRTLAETLRGRWT